MTKGRPAMRRITLWLLSTVAALVLLFSYRTSTNDTGAAVAAATAPATTPSTAGPVPQETGPSPTTSPSASASDGGTGAAKTYTGASASTRWGDVQVTITVAGGRITDVQVPVYPTGNGRDQEINAYAVPALVQETLEAQGSDIDVVSGATVTSEGYLQSLQSALDAAHLS
ncbi:FMN-binding protein [Actinoplanes sp. URMC 104]|uniref:FMN-binding protein n=1 Tax=Actinoplanes sp. URMC 104 TaxID=3423409 RepID=UPI003F1A1785